MIETDNYGLKKPESDDKYGDFVPGVFSDNMDIIDSALYELSQRSGGSTGIGIGTPAAKGVTTATAGVGRIVNE
ncbi:hypothetical protein [Ruminococcus flavefaciens]|uniref:hypothetical protein n=1 Tax=Ruminococcus flavefaciens TaxID=1265 RepID=UPI0026F04207|nr:hypothetical protein [Ruminococcus flavefaciens]